jgi:hypothetical protein
MTRGRCKPNFTRHADGARLETRIARRLIDRRRPAHRFAVRPGQKGTTGFLAGPARRSPRRSIGASVSQSSCSIHRPRFPSTSRFTYPLSLQHTCQPPLSGRPCAKADGGPFVSPPCRKPRQRLLLRRREAMGERGLPCMRMVDGRRALILEFIQPGLRRPRGFFEHRFHFRHIVGGPLIEWKYAVLQAHPGKVFGVRFAQLHKP